MAWKVLAVNPHPDETYEIEHAILRPLGVEIRRVRVRNDAELIGTANDADVVMPVWYHIRREVIRNLDLCRLIPSVGIGFDHIDADAATERGILVTNMAETYVEEVANHAWMLLLLVARRGFWLHEMATTNRWEEANESLFPILRLSMPRVTGQTLGLVPFGRIPRGMARRAHGFGMPVVAYDPYVSAEVFREHGVEQVGLDDVFRRADYVSCHLPLTKETFHLIGDAQFRLMKPSAFFISTGRGRVVDEAALIAALDEGRIAGAGLDVLEQEPPDPLNPLLRRPNVVVSPHMASVSDVSEVDRRRLIGSQIAAVLQGKIPHGVVNPKALPAWLSRWART
ncbi:MAG TPA: C-terminal binding protein [Chloroflexota bacterium]|nr:C-terminal binding protein [Chloroflexota bacterium]